MNTNNLINKAILCSLAMAGATLLPSCVSPKEVLYIQDVSGNSRETIKANYQTTIQKDEDGDKNRERGHSGSKDFLPWPGSTTGMA